MKITFVGTLVDFYKNDKGQSVTFVEAGHSKVVLRSDRVNMEGIPELFPVEVEADCVGRVYPGKDGSPPSFVLNVVTLKITNLEKKGGDNK